jgi:hypothetical protein
MRILSIPPHLIGDRPRVEAWVRTLVPAADTFEPDHDHDYIVNVWGPEDPDGFMALEATIDLFSNTLRKETS